LRNHERLHEVQAKQEQDDAANQQEFDHFMGADAGAFAYGDYDEDDKEADEIYASVEDIMDKRRKVRTSLLCLYIYGGLRILVGGWGKLGRGRNHLCFHPCEFTSLIDR
jgi:PRP1 splicing factor, N-terminal